MSEQTINELIENAQAELEQAIREGDQQVIHDLESYIDDLENEVATA